MHNSTTEAVRLPPEGEGGVTVHPAVRSKLPLKRKVREGNSHNKHKNRENNNTKGTKIKRSPKKKKRVSAAVGAEETRKAEGDAAAVIEVPPSKVKKSQPNKKKKKKKEVIDYSLAQGDLDGKKELLNAEVVQNPLTPEADPVGKVQNWLLKSQLALPKSKSTPAGLADKTNRPTQKRLVPRPRPDKSKANSLGNIPNEKEKVRLQVVYKPPFKFSVKLRKPEKTSVVMERPVADRGAIGRKPENSSKNHTRTGVLVRTVKDSEFKSQKLSARNGADGATVSSATSPLTVDVLSTKPLPDDIDSNVHTVQSDLEVLLSESEFLFSDD